MEANEEVQVDDGPHQDERNDDAPAVDDNGEGDGGGDEANGPLSRDEIVSEANVLFQELRASGRFNEQDVRKVIHAQIALLYGMLELDRCQEGPITDVIHVAIATGANDDERILLPDGLNLVRHWWEQFTRKLSSVPSNDHGYIHLGLQQIHLGNALVTDLLPVLSKAPIQALLLRKNDLLRDHDGLKFVLDAIGATPTLELLFIESNPLNLEDVSNLMDVVINHPRIDALALSSCGMGRESECISSAVTRALQNLQEVSLIGNSLGSHSAKFIAECLSKNPIVEKVILADNQLGDKDASMLAWSLRSNTNLQLLRLNGNQITQHGFSVLKDALFNKRSMNHVSHHSNHNCFIVSGEGTFSQINNRFLDEDKNRRMKVGLCLPVFNVLVNIRDIPIGILPRIIVILQGLESIFTVNGLDATFRLMRQWNMPLLFTSSAGNYPRRSNRIRSKKVAQLMGK